MAATNPRRPDIFWTDKDQERILLTTILALVPAHSLKQINKKYLANVVGEGKLTVRSLRAKTSQLMIEGRQRLEDHAARNRAGDEIRERGSLVTQSLPVRGRSIEPVHPRSQVDSRNQSCSRSPGQQRRPDQGPSDSSKAPGQENRQVRSQENKRPLPQSPISTSAESGPSLTYHGHHTGSERNMSAVKRPRIDSSYARFIKAEGQNAHGIRQPSKGTWGSQEKPIDLDVDGVGALANQNTVGADITPTSSASSAVLSSRRNNEPGSSSIPAHDSVRHSRAHTGNAEPSDENVMPTSYRTQPVQKVQTSQKAVALQMSRTDNPQIGQNATQVRSTKRLPSGKIHQRPVANKTRTWQNNTIREVSVTESEMGRLGYRSGNEERA